MERIPACSLPRVNEWLRNFVYLLAVSQIFLLVSYHGVPPTPYGGRHILCYSHRHLDLRCSIGRYLFKGWAECVGLMGTDVLYRQNRHSSSALRPLEATAKKCCYAIPYRNAARARAIHYDLSICIGPNMRRRRESMCVCRRNAPLH